MVSRESTINQENLNLSLISHKLLTLANQFRDFLIWYVHFDLSLQ